MAESGGFEPLAVTPPRYSTPVAGHSSGALHARQSWDPSEFDASPSTVRAAGTTNIVCAHDDPQILPCGRSGTRTPNASRRYALSGRAPRLAGHLPWTTPAASPVLLGSNASASTSTPALRYPDQDQRPCQLLCRTPNRTTKCRQAPGRRPDAQLQTRAHACREARAHLEPMGGLEPPALGLGNPRSRPLSYIGLEPPAGNDPASRAYRARALPLSYKGMASSG